jgi:hypothetical protein
MGMACKIAARILSAAGLTDSNSIRAVREFLITYSEPKPESTKDTTGQQTQVRGVGDVVVKLAQLEHR